uniref:Thaumatin-like protein n=1 Tax=Leersia perrieri TaxID=77586 RepID=A0A0D9XHS6_9ORYZ
MAMAMVVSPRSVTVLVLFFFIFSREGETATLTFVNRCGDTVWPGVLSNAGSARLATTGFELPPGAARACSGAGAAPPATLAEFTLDGTGAGLDFYDVSLVDGYNLPLLVEPSGNGAVNGGSLTSAATCAPAGCAADLNAMCPAELRAGGGAACRSACDAFGRPEFCCSGAYANPTTCRPTAYSQVFKSACPRSYSYAFDDPTSTFTCSGRPDYTVTFCPAATPSSSQKSTTTTPPATMMPGTATPATTTTIPGTMPGATMPGTATATTMPGTTFTDANPDTSMPMPMSGGGAGGEPGEAVVLSGSETWIANMATGEFTAAAPMSPSRPSAAAAALAILLFLLR